MPQTLIVICLILTVAAGLVCAMSQRLVKAAMALAALSALVSLILFLFGALWAAIFELSCCMGIVTVLFTSAISLTRPQDAEPESEADTVRRFSVLPLLLIFVGVMLLAVLIATDFSLDAITVQNAVAESFRDVAWGSRQADILGQVILILVAAVSIVVLFKESDK